MDTKNLLVIILTLIFISAIFLHILFVNSLNKPKNKI